MPKFTELQPCDELIVCKKALEWVDLIKRPVSAHFIHNKRKMCTHQTRTVIPWRFHPPTIHANYQSKHLGNNSCFMYLVRSFCCLLHRFTGISMHCCCSDLENIQIYSFWKPEKNNRANCVYKPKALKCYLVCTKTLLYHIAGIVIEVKATPFAFKLQLGTQKGCNIMWRDDLTTVRNSPRNNYGSYGSLASSWLMAIWPSPALIQWWRAILHQGC